MTHQYERKWKGGNAISQDEPPRVLYNNERFKLSLNWRSAEGDIYSFTMEAHMRTEPKIVREKIEELGGRAHKRIEIDGFYEIDGMDTIKVEPYSGSNRGSKGALVKLTDFESSADHEKIKKRLQSFITRGSELLKKIGSEQDKDFCDRVLPDLFKISATVSRIPPKEELPRLVYEDWFSEIDLA